MLIAFHKPYGVLSQFTPDGSAHRPLAEFGLPPRVYPLGRLDATSEGLLLLSDEPGLNERLLHPRYQHERTYWAQVERIPEESNLVKLRAGLKIADYCTLPCSVRLIEPEPPVNERQPPVRFRKNVPTAWLEITLMEGKNHQVRKMTAAIGHPTLRLIRVRISDIMLGDLNNGQWRVLDGIDLRNGRYRVNK